MSSSSWKLMCKKTDIYCRYLTLIIVSPVFTFFGPVFGLLMSLMLQCVHQVIFNCLLFAADHLSLVSCQHSFFSENSWLLLKSAQNLEHAVKLWTETQNKELQGTEVIKVVIYWVIHKVFLLPSLKRIW